MIDTVVKVFFPDREYGFLQNPDPSEKDIFFHIRGRHKKKGDSFVPVENNVGFPSATHKVQILELVPTPEGPRASKWRLMM